MKNNIIISYNYIIMSFLIEKVKTNNILNEDNLEDIKECIICLQNNNQIIKYSSNCECNPYVHKECLDEWYKVYPNMCPICRNQNSPNNLIIINNHANNRRFKILLGICCLLFFSCIIIIILIFIIIINSK